MVEHVVAERAVICQMASGEFRPVQLQVGLPLPLADGGWVCEVALKGLYPGMPKVPGVDSLQCMGLAQNLICQALHKFVDGGGRLFWRDGSGPVTVEAMFPV